MEGKKLIIATVFNSKTDAGDAARVVDAARIIVSCTAVTAVSCDAAV